MKSHALLFSVIGIWICLGDTVNTNAPAKKNSITLEYVNTLTFTPPALPTEIPPYLKRISSDLWVLYANTNHVLMTTNHPYVEKVKAGYQISFP